MNIESARMLAEDQNLTLQKLEELVGIDETVDHLLAKHPNASAELLQRLVENYDEDTLSNALQNPNVPIVLVQDYGPRFPHELLRNPSFSLFQSEFPDIFDVIPRLLELPECPASDIRHYAKLGNRLQQFMILCNPAIPEDIQNELIPDFFVSDALSKLSQLLQHQTKPEMKQYLEAYMQTSRPYCMPKFLPLDLSNIAHRMDDQVIKGFPFTSASWPWPISNEGKYLQPAAQINLENAGNLLGVDLGQGLLQVWLDVLAPMVRVIPPKSFSEPLDEFYPDDAPWNDEDFYECPIQQETDVLPYPRVKWIPMGRMFPHPAHTFEKFWGEEIGAYSRQIEKLNEKLNELGIPVWMYQYFGSNRFFDPFLRLGGYQYGSGNEADLCDWPEWKDGQESANDECSKVLLYIGCEVHTLAVTYSKRLNGDCVFGVDIRYDN